MINKMVSSLITALVLLFCLNQTASAGELFGVGVSYIYLPQDDSQNIDSMSGRIVYLTLPLFFGVGQEEYNFSFKDGAGRNLGFDVDMKDIYFSAPIPGFIIHIGIGAGDLKPKDTLPSDYQGGDKVLQAFVRGGVPFGIFNFHFTLHEVRTNLHRVYSHKIGEDFSYQVTSIGLGMGF